MKRLTIFFFLLLFALSLQGQKVITNDGKALRVYDANLPLKTPYTLSFWVEGKDASSFTLDDTSVDNWADKSGNGNDVANANDNDTRPTYDSSTGRVTFTAANNTFLQSAAFGSALSQPNTIFVVYKITGAVGATYVVFDNINSNQHAVYYGSSVFKLYAGTVITDGATNANDNIHAALFNGASSEYWINGTSVVSGYVGASTLSGIILGTRFDHTATWADCEISEVIVFDGAISDTWRDKITAYLADKWSITATTDFKGYVLRYTAAAAGWVSPTGKEDDSWTDAENIYDGNIATSGKESTNGQSVTLTIASISCDKIRINAGLVAGGQANLVIEVYYSAAFHQIHSGVLTEDTWQEISVGSTQDITKVKLSTGSGINTEVWELELNSL